MPRPSSLSGTDQFAYRDDQLIDGLGSKGRLVVEGTHPRVHAGHTNGNTVFLIFKGRLTPLLWDTMLTTYGCLTCVHSLILLLLVRPTASKGRLLPFQIVGHIGGDKLDVERIGIFADNMQMKHDLICERAFSQISAR